MLENIIKDFEKYLDTSFIKKEADNQISYSLMLNDSSEISVHNALFGIYLHAKITTFDESSLSSPEEFYTYLMKANFIGQGTGNSVISIDENQKFLTLSHLIDYEVNYKMFRDIFEDFTNYLSFWQKEIPKKV